MFSMAPFTNIIKHNLEIDPVINIVNNVENN